MTESVFKGMSKELEEAIAARKKFNDELEKTLESHRKNHRLWEEVCVGNDK